MWITRILNSSWQKVGRKFHEIDSNLAAHVVAKSTMIWWEIKYSRYKYLEFSKLCKFEERGIEHLPNPVPFKVPDICPERPCSSQNPNWTTILIPTNAYFVAKLWNYPLIVAIKILFNDEISVLVWSLFQGSSNGQTWKYGLRTIRHTVCHIQISNVRWSRAFTTKYKSLYIWIAICQIISSYSCWKVSHCTTQLLIVNHIRVVFNIF